MKIAGRTALRTVATLLFLFPVALPAWPGASGSSGASVSRVFVSFKLDPRLSGPTYGGERWVSPPTYTGMSEGKEFMVEAKADALNEEGNPIDTRVEWTPAESEMVIVTPAGKNRVQINVKRAGEMRLKVSAQSVFQELLIRAKYVGTTVRYEIAQMEGKK